MIQSDVVRICLLIGVFLMTDLVGEAVGQRPGINEDESKVPAYTLPRLLEGGDGTQFDSIESWEQTRRPQVQQLFADHVYGNFPSSTIPVEFVPGEAWEVLDGKAIRKEVAIKFGPNQELAATLLLTIPKSEKSVPCFLGYNFHGNHTTTDDPRVSITEHWVHNGEATGAQNNQASDSGRGASASRWPYEMIVDHGYAVGTIYYGDIDPDFDDEFQNGVHPLFLSEGESKPGKQAWGSIGAWAWALSRVLDYVESDRLIDGKHVAVIGHSRLGKTSLWAGATDRRFWITISNNSGCGGAALHRRKFGETVKVINTSFPHWFCDTFVEYNDNESAIPVDQHMLMALIAPRPVYVASASKDLWADPKGEYLALAHADDVFGLYGESPLPADPPQAGQPLFQGRRGYHLREGEHDITPYDWQQYLRFADRHRTTEK